MELSDLHIYPLGFIFLPLELAVAFAQVQAEVEPTLLVIDEIMGSIPVAMRYIYSFLADVQLRISDCDGYCIRPSR